MSDWQWVLGWCAAGGILGTAVCSRTGRSPWIGLASGIVLGPLTVGLFLLDAPKATSQESATDSLQPSDRRNLMTKTQNTLSESDRGIAPMAYAAMFSAVPILFMPFLFIFPLTFGILALRDIKRNPRYVGKGRAIFGIAWGVIGILLCILVALVLLESSQQRK
jgi:hypothetical protein